MQEFIWAGRQRRAYRHGGRDPDPSSSRHRPDPPLPHTSQAPGSPALPPGVILACCRSWWAQPLAREAMRALHASLYASERPTDVAHKARVLSSLDQRISLIIHEVCLGWTTRELRSAFPEVPVLAIGSRDDLRERLRAAASGSSAFLPPPVGPREILRAAAAILAAPTDAPTRATELPPSDRVELAERSRIPLGADAPKPGHSSA